MGPAVSLITHPSRLLLTGRSTMGKTTLAVDIICHSLIRKVKRVFAVCPTFWQQPSLARLRNIKGAFNKTNVFTKVNDEVFEYIYQILITQPADTLIFVDDAAAEAATNKGNKGAFARLCISCNHNKTSMVAIFQRLTSATVQLRSNCEGLISFIPSDIASVDVIYKEFNPSPASPQSKEIVQKALLLAWTNARFCFIWREAFTGKIYFHIGLKYLIRFNDNITTAHDDDDASGDSTEV